ncbi:hypothetical protein FA13DRAFT_1709970 [Coprinellus micaceus]|uniref:Uncharacterized protein n=1 Tax=Coprinellus micaceus TaxID=71717 RepID=A0A4Y7TC31_COPMI|nr:hypothetical protein FA13DRAFT_1709970 [Coprinellus micaceus]
MTSEAHQSLVGVPATLQQLPISPPDIARQSSTLIEQTEPETQQPGQSQILSKSSGHGLWMAWEARIRVGSTDSDLAAGLYAALHGKLKPTGHPMQRRVRNPWSRQVEASGSVYCDVGTFAERVSRAVLDFESSHPRVGRRHQRRCGGRNEVGRWDSIPGECSPNPALKVFGVRRALVFSAHISPKSTGLHPHRDLHLLIQPWPNAVPNSVGSNSTLNLNGLPQQPSTTLCKLVVRLCHLAQPRNSSRLYVDAKVIIFKPAGWYCFGHSKHSTYSRFPGSAYFHCIAVPVLMISTSYSLPHPQLVPTSLNELLSLALWIVQEGGSHLCASSHPSPHHFVALDKPLAHRDIPPPHHHFLTKLFGLRSCTIRSLYPTSP